MTQGFFPTQLTTGELYASKMITALRPNGRVLSPEIALRENPNAFDLVYNCDSACRHAIDTSSNRIAGYSYVINQASPSPADREMAQWYREVMQEVENFTNARQLMARDARYLGEYYGFVEGKRKRLNLLGKGVQEYWIPTKIRHVARSRIRKINKPDGSIEVLLFRDKTRKWEPLTKEQQTCLLRISNSDDESRFTNGSGLIDPLFIAYTFKKNAEGEMINLLERFGQGFTVLGIDETSEGSELKDLQDLNTTYQTLLANAKARHALIIRKSDELKILDPSATGYQVIKDMIDYYDNQILMVCLGSTLSVKEAQFGTRAQSVTHGESADNYLRPDRVAINEAITFQLFRKIIYRFNYPQLVAIGLGSARPPLFEVPEDRRDDYEKNGRILEKAQAMGAIIKKDQFYQLQGLEQAAEGDEVINPPLQNISAPVEPFEPVETQALVQMPKTGGKDEGVTGEVSELPQSNSEDSPQKQFSEEEAPEGHVMMDPQKFATEKLREFYTNPTRKNKFNALRAVELADKIKRGQAV